MTNRFSLQ
ncbi:Protein of unknown function [Bacillus cytotoxicus]|nr:Protein of unknown function [Bacillus mycoides]SCN31545.1 Protein of unknown function [Bacillus cytotoxicus]